jgi:hypothetical protein
MSVLDIVSDFLIMILAFIILSILRSGNHLLPTELNPSFHEEEYSGMFVEK